mmetsp:Transcript_16917/g.46789  ORF Transcript_16917/g.46789 Transcript_16917/m.46789 type:complete len:229 (+) Transcript_16917:302-988(+)
MGHGFDHVVDRERRSRCTRQGLHLHARLVRHTAHAMDGRDVAFQLHVDLDLIQRQRMAQRDEVARFFRGHDARQLGSAKDGSFRPLHLAAILRGKERIHDLGRKHDLGLRLGRAPCDFLGAHVDHMHGRSIRRNMREWHILRPLIASRLYLLQLLRRDRGVVGLSPGLQVVVGESIQRVTLCLQLSQLFLKVVVVTGRFRGERSQCELSSVQMGCGRTARCCNTEGTL